MFVTQIQRANQTRWLLDEASAASNEQQLPQFPSSFADWSPDLPWDLIDGGDEGCDGEDTAVAAHAETPLQHKKKRKKINPNKARDERRFQLIELKEQVAELELTLQCLQTVRSKRPKRFETASYDSGVPPVWQEICSRQLNRRLEAERENMKLKMQYENEKQLVKSLEKMLHKRHVPANDTEPQATKQTRRTDIPDGYIERMAAMIF
ncbi:hypothetical protein GN958_ATG08737 [Phytophthora infestans]|uniref:Uncharacterized protein n=1 Tax=Phytophthora infestans TaxID=4787 RepID=A0A8S9UR44_PHYIN|nr:hypothetical protein GN958_ATG08737 [Phytophthora infestans]